MPSVSKAGDKLDEAFIIVTTVLFRHYRQALPAGGAKTLGDGVTPLRSVTIRMPAGNQVVNLLFDIGRVARTHQLARRRCGFSTADIWLAAGVILGAAAAGA